jgi:hypothetical protein
MQSSLRTISTALSSGRYSKPWGIPCLQEIFIEYHALFQGLVHTKIIFDWLRSSKKSFSRVSKEALSE